MYSHTSSLLRNYKIFSLKSITLRILQDFHITPKIIKTFKTVPYLLTNFYI